MYISGDDISRRRSKLSAAKQALLEKRLRGELGGSSQYLIPRRARKGPAPLSFTQQRLWFLDQLEPGSSAYNEFSAVRLAGMLNVTALEQSLNEMIRRHEILRTKFTTVNGRAVQVAASTSAMTLPVADLRALPEVEQEVEARRLATEEVQRPFNLAQGPLLRAVLLCLDKREHVLLLTMHHIVFDGWSRGILDQEMTALYEAFTTGESSPLPDLPIQYADFAIWQREWLQGKVLEEQLAYWRQQLDGAPVMIELPTDRPRPPIQTSRGAMQSFTLSKTLVDVLKTLSRQEGVTLFITLLAAFKTLLYRYTGQEDIIVGSPIASRNRSEIEGLIGCFVNTLVIRVDLSGNPSFRELLRRVREIALEAYAHQDLPFEMLVEHLQLERSLSHTPLFQVMFVFQTEPAEVLRLSGLTVSPFEVDSEAAKFDLTLYVTGAERGLAGALEYNTDLFDAATIDRMSEHFQTLLEGIVRNSGQRLSDLPLLTDLERHQVLVEWNNTQTDYCQDRCIHELFEVQVELAPDAVAVTFAGQHLTYQELNCRANQLAHYLRELGVGPDTYVGICVERSLEMVIGLYGVLKAGGAYVPLDPTYPPARLAFMLTDAQVPVLLTLERLVSMLPPHDAQIVCLDADWEAISRREEQNLVAGITADNLAYVIYTSGSTGRPKGVQNTHKGIRNRLLWMQDTFQLAKVDRVMQKTPFSFDVSVWEFFWPLLTGACLVMAQPGGHKSSAYLVETVIKQNITTMHFVPSMLQVFVEEHDVKMCHSLKRVICSGEALPFDLQQRFFIRLDAELHNLYGPTEAAVDVSFWLCERESSWRIVPIGRPIANIQIYLLDAHLQPVPVGVPGELHIGGIGLARGYHNRPQLTAERFIPDPFSEQPGARLYKTGDLARYLPDGNIEFLCRIDHQVKVRGFRIELGEVEAALAQHPAVRTAVALVREGYSGNKQLVAYLVTANGQEPTVSELRRFLLESLPGYMVPSAFVILETLPLMPNGKVDRRTLPAPGQARPELERAFVAPRVFVEKVLANAWAEVLGLERVGVYDNFFELGGDSIISIQVIAKVGQAGIRLIPKQFFEYQTVAGLAAVADTSLVIQAEQGLVTGPVPLTPIQCWFFEQDLPDPYHFNQASLLKTKGSLDPALLEDVLRQLLLHHDALRLRFERTASGWQQFNAGWDGSVPFTQVDLSTLSVAEQGLAISGITVELQSSLDLSAGPLIRVVLFELGQRQLNRLLIIIHHLAVDNVSWRILLGDLETAYQQLSRGEAVELPPKTTSFKQWAERLAEHAHSEEVEQELDEWLVRPWEKISSLPVDYPEGINTVASIKSVSVSLSVEETEALRRDMPRVYRTQINDGLLTALAQAFVRWTGQDLLLIDLEGHGREEVFDNVDLSRTVGWFTIVFPVLLDLRGACGPVEALNSVREQLRRIPNRGINYGVLRYMSDSVRVVREVQVLPQPEVSFNYLGQLDQALSESSVLGPALEPGGPHQSLQGARRYSLEINGSISGGQLRLEWVYSENLYRHSTIEKLAQEFVEALRMLIAHCESLEAGEYTSSDFPLAGLDEQKLKRLSVLIDRVDEVKGISA
jgi:amino acid adenylation domain-containing protein/non-ribosomal peptide synthase protein (TIGR01720 family)